MALLDTIAEAMKIAMKSRDQLRLETLRTIRAGLLEKQVEKRPSGGMNADDEVAVLLSASKKRKEAAEIYRQNKREDLAIQEERELAIIQEYLPQQVNPAEIEEVARKYILQTGSSTAKDFGKVMPLVMKELKGRADGKVIGEIVKSLLGG